MAVFKPKTRMISFRIAEEEFQILERIALAQGARSVPGYARSALCRLIARRTEVTSDDFEAMIIQLDERIQELHRELERLHQLAEHRGARAATEEVVIG